MAARQVAVGLQRLAQLAAGAGLVGFGMQECLYNVDGGERVVIFDRFSGVSSKTVGEGTHFRIPLLQYPHHFDVRSRPRIINTTTGTRDLQMVSIALRVLSRPVEADLPKIYQEIGLDFDERVLPSIGNEVLKAVVAHYNADQLLTMREKVSQEIRDALTQRASNFHLILDDVAITHLQFGKDFTTAVEQKQVALQEAERSKFVVERAEQERLVSVINAEGEAEAAEVISKALRENGSGLIEVRRIDAAKEIAQTLANSRNISYLPSGNSGMLLNLGVGN